VRFVSLFRRILFVRMWKHVLAAASFDSVWGTNNPVTGLAVVSPAAVLDIDGAPTAAETLRNNFANIPDTICNSAVGSVEVTAEVGVTGTLNITVADADEFYSDSDNAEKIAVWISSLFPSVPDSDVTVTIPVAVTAAPTTAASVATPSSGVPESVPDSADPVPTMISTSFVLVLRPGKAEISSRLSTKPAADILAVFNSQLSDPAGVPLVSSASVTMSDITAGNVPGTFVLATTDTSAAGIQSVANQEHIRAAIAALAEVYIGDVSPITITSADPLVPLEAEPSSGDTVGPNTEVAARRLTAGSVNAAFTIQVPGHAANGYAKDCSLQKVKASAVAGTTPSVATPSECGTQSLTTALTTGATAWSWDADDTTCTLTNQALLSSRVFDSNSITAFNAGEDACGSCPSVLLPLPEGGWPLVATDATTSNAAFGTQGQPLNLQCWPKNSNYDLMPCGHQVLERFGSADVASAWAGACNNLDEDTAATTQALCQSNCENDPFCTVWQWSAEAGSTAPLPAPSCFRGVGNKCFVAETDSSARNITASQRIQHGLVNVVVDGGYFLSHVLSGLQKQFGENIGVEVPRLSTFEAQRDACRNICHSNILCQYWQSFYDDGLSSDLGCWTENPGVDSSGDRNQNDLGVMIAYPLTHAGFRPNGVEGDETKIKGAQYIQHHCPIPTLPQRPAATVTTTTTVLLVAPALVTTAAPSGGFMNPWGYLLIGLFLIAAIALLAFMFLCSQPKKPKSTRAVKPIKAKEPPPPPPQPVVPLMMQQMMVQPTIQQPLAMTTIQQPYTTVPAQAIAQPMMMQRPY